MNEGSLLETATLAGGCFWCLEAIFLEIEGVHSVVPGYTGGSTDEPSYEEVCTDTTGHAEAIQVVFDPALISYRTILEIFFSIHDPTSLNRQGHDVGTQYRSAIFYRSDDQKALAEEVIADLERARLWERPIVTEIAPLGVFHPAEDYHREYLARHPEQSYCRAVITPKLSQFRKRWAARIKR